MVRQQIVKIKECFKIKGKLQPVSLTVFSQVYANSWEILVIYQRFRMPNRLFLDIMKITMISVAASFFMTLIFIVLSYGYLPELNIGMKIGLTISIIIPAIISFPVAHFLLSQKNKMRALNNELSNLLRYDQLTSCLSRRAFFQEADAAIQEARRKQQPYSVFFIDLDHFKQVNDTFGHDTGDEVLRLLGKVIKQQKQHGEFVGRMGGEEFCLFAQNCPADQASARAQKLVDEFRHQAQVVNKENVNCTLSIGISVSNGIDDLDKKLKEADRLLYAAKKRGRNCIAIDFKANTETRLAA